jgi:hypothetical protein
MHRVETFRFPQAHMQQFHCPQLEAGIVDSLNDVTRVTRAYRVGFDNSECKIAHLLF